MPPEPRKRSRSVQKSRTYTSVAVDDALVARVVQFAKKNRGQSLTMEKRQGVILAQAYLRSEHRKKQVKVGPGRKETLPKFSDSIAAMFCWDPKLIRKIWAEWLPEFSVNPVAAPANKKVKPKTVEYTRLAVSRVQAWVRKRRITRTRTVAKVVMAFLHRDRRLEYAPNDSKSTSAALRPSQRFLTRNSYRRGRKKGF